MLGTTYPIVFGLGFARQVDAEAALSGESNLIAAAVVLQDAAAAFSGASDLVATAEKMQEGSASFSGESDLSASANITAFASVDMVGLSDASLTAYAIRMGYIDMDAQSNLVVNASPVLPAQCALSGTSNLMAQPMSSRGAETDLFAESNFAANGLRITFGGSSLSGESDLVLGEPDRVYDAQCSMSQDMGTLSATGPTLYHLIPVTYDASISFDYLFGRVQYKQSYSVLIKDGAASLVTDPAQENLSFYDQYFLGGRRYQIDAVTAAILQANDLGEYVEVG